MNSRIPEFPKSRIPFLLLPVALVALSACNGNKPYTINGTLDLPAQIPYGDTVVDVPSFNDTWVYLFDFDYNPIDSALIEDNKFHFEGEVKPDEVYYAQFACQLGQALIAIEPGDIEVYINPDIIVSGTPSNDCMADIDAALSNLNNDTYARLAQFTDNLHQIDQEPTEGDLKRFSDEFQRAMNAVLDSAYEDNKNNQGAAYAVLMKLVSCNSSKEFEQKIAEYPEKVQQNELIQTSLKMLRQYEQMADTSDFEPSLFPEEDGAQK